MTPKTIILAGRDFPVQELNFAQLKRLLPAINRVARAMAVDQLDETAMDDMGTVLSAGTGVPAAELDALPIRANELSDAFSVIVNLAGLGPKEEGTKMGEEERVANGTGTSSTLTSPPVSAGLGETSTN